MQTNRSFGFVRSSRLVLSFPALPRTFWQNFATAFGGGMNFSTRVIGFPMMRSKADEATITALKIALAQAAELLISVTAGVDYLASEDAEPIAARYRAMSAPDWTALPVGDVGQTATSGTVDPYGYQGRLMRAMAHLDRAIGCAPNGDEVARAAFALRCVIESGQLPVEMNGPSCES